MIAPQGRDIHVYRVGPGKTGVALEFFATLTAYERQDEWVVLTFREGGQIKIPIARRASAVWVEPERH